METTAKGISDATNKFTMEKPPGTKEEWRKLIRDRAAEELPKVGPYSKLDPKKRGDLAEDPDAWSVADEERGSDADGETRQFLDEWGKITQRRTLIVLPRHEETEKWSGAINGLSELLTDGIKPQAVGGTSPAASTEATRPQFAVAFEEVTLKEKTSAEKQTIDLRERLQVALTARQNTGTPTDLERTFGPVLLVGPTGSGKSAWARRAAGTRPFVPVNIAAVAPGLLESRMRGFKRGTFTGAGQDTKGWFEKAHGGVLFLDELQSAPLDVQTALLDLLSAVSNDVRVERLGEEGTPRACEVQVIVAINEPVHQLQKAGRLRKDFVHRMGLIKEFPSLNALIHEKDQAGAAFTHIRHLYYQICWCSVPNVSAVPHPASCYFPLFTRDMFQWLKNVAWAGNYREFERILVEAFVDSRRGKPVHLQRVQHFYERRRKALALLDSPDEAKPSPPLTDRERVRLDAVVETFRVHGSVCRSYPSLTKHRLRDRESLRKFVLRNREHFPPEIQADLDFQKTIRRG